MTQPEVAQALGVCETTIVRWRREGKIKWVRPARRVLIPASEVDRLLGLTAAGGSR